MIQRGMNRKVDEVKVDEVKVIGLTESALGKTQVVGVGEVTVADVIKAVEPHRLPEPGERRPPKLEEIKLDSRVREKDSVLVVLYLLLKTHQISRYNLKQMLGVLNDKPPEDLAMWLVQEAVKA